MFDHNALPDLIALQFDLASLNLQTSALCLTSNVSKNWQSDFLALGFLVGSDCLGYIGLLSVQPSGVETVSDSIMAL